VKTEEPLRRLIRGAHCRIATVASRHPHRAFNLS
jgi:hypothetical protein